MSSRCAAWSGVGVVVVTGVLGLASPARAQQTPVTRPPGPQAAATRPVVGPKEDLKDLTLVKSDTGTAVVRFRTAGLQVLVVGDRIGLTTAVVKSIAPGRLVIDEVAPGSDGTPQQTQIVLRDGETGGTRYRRRPDQPAPAGLRPQIVEPTRPTTPNSAKKPEAGPP